MAHKKTVLQFIGNPILLCIAQVELYTDFWGRSLSFVRINLFNLLHNMSGWVDGSLIVALDCAFILIAVSRSRSEIPLLQVQCRDWDNNIQICVYEKRKDVCIIIIPNIPVEQNILCKCIRSYMTAICWWVHITTHPTKSVSQRWHTCNGVTRSERPEVRCLEEWSLFS